MKVNMKWRWNEGQETANSHKPIDDNTAKLGDVAKAQAEAIDDSMAMRLMIGYGYNGMKVNMKWRWNEGQQNSCARKSRNSRNDGPKKEKVSMEWKTDNAIRVGYRQVTDKAILAKAVLESELELIEARSIRKPWRQEKLEK